LYILCSTLYIAIVHWTVHIVHWTVYIGPCTFYIGPCTLDRVHCTLDRIHCYIVEDLVRVQVQRILLNTKLDTTHLSFVQDNHLLIKFTWQGLHDAQVYPCLVHLCMRQSHSRGSWLTWKEAVKTLSNTLTTSMFNRQIIKLVRWRAANSHVTRNIPEESAEEFAGTKARRAKLLLVFTGSAC